MNENTKPYRLRIASNGQFITVQELTRILAERPYDMQLFHVKGRIGNSRFRLDFVADDKLVARLECLMISPMFEACKLSAHDMEHLANNAKFITEPGSF